MAEHTSGPWRITGQGTIRAGDNDWIARAHWRNKRANALLISAAPDLAEAIDHLLLRQLFAAIEDSGTPEATKLWGIAMAWFDVRDAALAKATGA